LSDSEPIPLRPRLAGAATASQPATQPHAFTPSVTAFNRQELSEILAVYGRMVASGEWRDYAMDMGKETACFSVFRRTSEVPLYRIEKTPKLARKQGAYSVISASGLILKRGHELKRVLGVFDKTLKLVDA
jgi:Protein of unknown function (DUF2794)